jgi:hypothetical protein
MAKAWEVCSSNPGLCLIYKAGTSSITVPSFASSGKSVFCDKTDTNREVNNHTFYASSRGFKSRFRYQIKPLRICTFPSVVQTNAESRACCLTLGDGGFPPYYFEFTINSHPIPTD